MRKTISDDRSKRARERRRIEVIVKTIERDFCESGKSRFYLANFIFAGDGDL